MRALREKQPVWLIRLILAAAAFFMLAAAVNAHEPENVQILEQKMQENTVVLYLKTALKDETASVQIGSIQAEDAVIDGIGGEIPARTWLLIDNSQSIPREDRVRTLQLFSDLVAGRMKNEKFNLCTFDEHLQILLEDSQSYPDLKAAMEGIEYKTQETYLTDVLNELLELEKARNDSDYVRIILACDGGDTNPSGVTMAELSLRLASEGIPIYILGCRLNDNEQSLNEMYALSRMTGAQSWTITDIDNTLSIAETMSTAEAPVRATVPIPEEAKDGAQKGVKLTFSDGSTAIAQMAMPFGDPVAAEEAPPAPEPSPAPPAIEPSPEPEPVPPPEKKRNPLPLILTGAVLFAAAAAAAVVVLVRRKREKERIKQVDCLESSISNETVVLENQEDYDDSATMILVNAENRFMLRLTDLENPNRFFEAPLFERISIGRSHVNQIVIDYDKSVSNVHCEVFIDGTVFRIRDLHSSNGTYIDGIRIADDTELSNGSTIRMGRLEFVVEIR